MSARRASLVGAWMAAVSLLVTAWTVACGSSSGSAQGDAGSDASAADSGVVDAATVVVVGKDAAVDPAVYGCARIDASICFDFDDVEAGLGGWNGGSSISTNSSLTQNDLVELSPPYSARSALADGGIALAWFIFGGPASPTTVGLSLYVEGSDVTNADVVYAELESIADGPVNGIDFHYSCLAGDSQNCSSALDLTTGPAIVDAGVDEAGDPLDAGPPGEATTTTIPCGDFQRNQWVSILLTLELPDTGDLRVTCAVGNDTPITKDVPSVRLSPAFTWYVGGRAAGGYGGQVIDLDNVWFRY